MVAFEDPISARWWPVEEEFQASKILWFCGDGGFVSGGGIFMVVAGERRRLMMRRGE